MSLKLYSHMQRQKLAAQAANAQGTDGSIGIGQDQRIFDPNAQPDTLYNYRCSSLAKTQRQKRMDFEEWKRSRKRFHRMMREIGPVYERCRIDIFFFAKQMSFVPTWQQAQAMSIAQEESTMPYAQRKKRIAIKSGQGPGKTAVMCIIALWRALRAYRSMTIVTAPTIRQVTTVFFTELKRWIERAAFWIRDLLTVQTKKIYIAGDTKWFIEGMSASKPEALAGLHEEHMTVFFDEASGIMRSLWRTIAGTVSHQDSLWMAISNPTGRTSAFFDCFHADRELWHTLTWNAEDTARDYDHIAGDNHIRIERTFGRDSDAYRVSVLGEFPNMDSNAVISSEDLEKCTDLGPNSQRFYKLVAARHPLTGAPIQQIGIDLARHGPDESVIYARQGYAVVKEFMANHAEPLDVIKMAFMMQRELGWSNADTVYVFDAGGLGNSLAKVFNDAGKAYVEFQNGGIARESGAFRNAITEAYFDLRKLTAASAIYVPRDPRLFAQLTTRQYKWDTKDGVLAAGRYALEKKDDYRDRLVREGAVDVPSSPDRADALAMAFYDIHSDVGQGIVLGSRGAKVSAV